MSSTLKSNRWLILVIACLAQFMVVLDNTIVNVALASIQRGLNFSSSGLPWVINAYTLIFGGFLMLGGRAADLLGRRRLFVIGITLFAGASVLNGLAQSSTMLILGRGLQGLGGALVSPAALSIIMTTFEDTRERTRALGVWAAVAASGSAFGLLLGGLLTDLVSWRWNFFINAPVAAATILLAFRFVPESHADLGHRRFDSLGATTVTAGLLSLVFGIVKAQTWGWGSYRTIAALGAGAVLLTVFVAIEGRAKAPLVKLSAFRIRSLTTGNIAMLLAAAAMFGMFYFISLYVQDVLGYSPLRAGVAFLPASIGIIIGAGIGQSLIPRVGVRPVATVGMLLAAAGMALLSRVPVHGSYVSDLLVGMVPMALGMGLTFVPVTLLGTSGVGSQDAGMASGLFNSAQQIGGSLGLAILATLAADHTSSMVHGGAVSHATQLQALVSGYHVAFIGGAAMLAAGAVLLILLLRRHHLEHVSVSADASAAAA